jgi:hypothetical protein
VPVVRPEVGRGGGTGPAEGLLYPGGLSEADLVVTREELAALHDQLYVLEAAIDDVERDLSTSSTKQDLVEALAWVMEAARPLIERDGTPFVN